MDERRLTVRQNHSERAQYCPANDLLPRDGRVTDLSERGIGLLTQEFHTPGERVTVSFSLEGSEPLTATGIARWSAKEPVHGRWYPLGVEWLPFEETTRNRLRVYLNESDDSRRGRRISADAAEERKESSASVLGRMVFHGMAIAGVVISLVLAWWGKRLHEENLMLAETVQRRNVIVSQLQNDTVSLQEELNRTRDGLTATIEEVARLDKQNIHFMTEMERLSLGLEDIQQQYVLLREDYTQMVLEHAELTQAFENSERQRQELLANLTSLPYLRQALKDATVAQKAQAQNIVIRELTTGRSEPEQETLQPERSSSSDEPVSWIRVHEPGTPSEVLSH